MLGGLVSYCISETKRKNRIILAALLLFSYINLQRNNGVFMLFLLFN